MKSIFEPEHEKKLEEAITSIEEEFGTKTALSILDSHCLFGIIDNKIYVDYSLPMPLNMQAYQTLLNASYGEFINHYE